MKLKEKLDIGSACFKARLFKKERPVFVSWAITSRCNLRCVYCHAWKEPSVELTIREAFNVVQDCASMGTRVIKFTGGEPLLREDLGEIIDRVDGLGMHAMVSTNGTLLPEKIKEIRKAKRICISLDGPEEVHDALRGKSSHAKALEALAIANKEKIPLSITTVLNSLNVNCVDYLLGIAKKFNTKISFQPAVSRILHGESPNPVAPDVDQYRAMVSSLMRLKERNHLIGNSLRGLRHLYRWPVATPIHCMAGKVICFIDPQGFLYSCGRLRPDDSHLNVRENGFRSCFSNLSRQGCSQCWCGALVELNLASQFEGGAVLNALAAWK